jgi:hypothetical protein
VALSAALSILWPAATAGAAEIGFGFESTGAEESTSVAGQHPDLTTSFVLNHEGSGESAKSIGRVKEVSVALPPGLVGNPAEFPTCGFGDFNAFGNCPVASQVGVVKVKASGLSEVLEPLYNLQPGPNQVAKLGFYALLYPIYIDVSVRTGSDYGVTATVHDASGQAALVSAKTTLWGVPADPVHDEQRLTPIEAVFGCETACTATEGKRSSGLNPRPFLSNPSACEEQSVEFAAVTYALPGQVFTGPPAALPRTTGCGKLAFDPSLQVEPTSHQAGAPTGLSAILRIPQNDAVSLPATSAMRAARVTLPEGMTINPSVAAGLEACSDAQVASGEEIDSNCPDSAKLGTATFVSPALPEPIHGAIYQRTPADGSLFRVWLVTDEFGLHLKLPGEIRADTATGRLTAEFTETPQLPVEEIDLEFKGGPRAPLKNPDACAGYSAAYELIPWSGAPPVTGQTQPMQINQGCSIGGFAPKLEAGVVNPVAGSYSPFVVNLKREDGEDNVSSLDVTLPEGELAKLKGVQLCPEADAATGACPADTGIGSVAVAVGAGEQPLWIPQPGKAPTGVFLAGPYKGAPYSVVTKVPAQAGPFDLGTVTVRGGLYVDSTTAQVTAKIDPLPQILEGVPVAYRTIHASIDRNKFAISPTNCREQSVDATVISAHGALAHPADRFQVGDCAALKFDPSLKLRLEGGTKRGGYPALTATLKARRGEANIRRVSVALPHSEFLAQEHINTVCTRVQFSEENCPKGSIYGRARVITPLLGQPLEGPVYLRSSSNPFPDLVVALHGQLDINLAGRIDSVAGGIRTTFQGVPDAPVAKFVLKMKGGKKSLLVNSTDICAARHRATVKMAGQNGKHHNPHPLLRGSCGGSGR